jgi:hypothetical protein
MISINDRQQDQVKPRTNWIITVVLFIILCVLVSVLYIMFQYLTDTPQAQSHTLSFDHPSYITVKATNDVWENRGLIIFSFIQTGDKSVLLNAKRFENNQFTEIELNKQWYERFREVMQSWRKAEPYRFNPALIPVSRSKPIA